MILNYNQETLSIIKNQFNEILFSTIQTQYLQRLRKISQTGDIWKNQDLQNNLNRFNHSVGTCQLSTSVLNDCKLLQNRKFSLLKEQISFYALCHDVGHGPYSHTLELYILPAIGIRNFCHEKFSIQIIEKIFEELQLPYRDIQVLESVLENGGKIINQPLFDFISNKKFGLDFDRFDYLNRDSQAYNGYSFFDIKDLKKICSIVRDYDNDNFDVCINESGLNLWDNFLQKWFDMFENVYQRKELVGYQLYQKDLFLNYSHYINLKEKILDFDQFIKLDDGIQNQIVSLITDQKIKSKIKRELFQKKFYNFICCLVFEEDFCQIQIQSLLKELFGAEDINKGDIRIKSVFNNKYKDVDFNNIHVLVDKSDNKNTIQNFTDFVKKIPKKKQVTKIFIFCIKKNNIKTYQKKLQKFWNQNQHLFKGIQIKQEIN